MCRQGCMNQTSLKIMIHEHKHHEWNMNIEYLFSLKSMSDWYLISIWWLNSCTTWDVWNPINNGKNYQPQLVSRISAINSIWYLFDHDISSPKQLGKGFSIVCYRWVSRGEVIHAGLYYPTGSRKAVRKNEKTGHQTRSCWRNGGTWSENLGDEFFGHLPRNISWKLVNDLQRNKPFAGFQHP